MFGFNLRIANEKIVGIKVLLNIVWGYGTTKQLGHIAPKGKESCLCKLLYRINVQ